MTQTSYGAPNTASTAAPTIPIVGLRQGSPHLVMIVPHEEGERQAAAMETWFQSCSTDEPFALELVGTRKEQGFVLRASSEEQLLLLCKQFEAQYPQAEISRIAPTADPLLVRSGEHALVGEFALAAPAWMPLKTFSGKALAEPGTDPLAGLLAAMEAVGSGERISCQLALMRAPDSWIAGDIRKAVEHPLQEERDRVQASQRGIPANPNAGGLKVLGGFIVLFMVLAGLHWYRQQAWGALILLAVIVGSALLLICWWWFFNRQPPIYDMKLVAEKLMRAAFYTQLRVIVIGREALSTEQRLRTLISHMEIAYRQFTLTSANSLYVKRIRHLRMQEKNIHRLHSVEYAFPYYHPLLRLIHKGAPCKGVWNGLELSGAFHLPQETTDLPLVRRIGVKHLLFSPEVSTAITTAREALPPVLIGHSRHRSHTSRVLLPFPTLFSHKFLVGRSRSGKSVLMQLMLRGAMQKVIDGSPQPGIFVIDPHHDLIEDLLGIIPKERFVDVLLLDFTDTDYPVGLNPLDVTMGFSRDQAVSNLMSCFERVWSEFWGPRMAYFLKAVCLLLYTLNIELVREGKAHKQYTILDINPILQYQDYAKQVLSHLDKSEPWHQELLSWWQNVYFTLPKQSSFRQEVIMPILSKLGVFNDNQVLRRIVGQAVTTAPVHEAITRGCIVLCALSSRDLDDASVNILGSTLINLLHRSFARQQHIPLLDRRKVFVAVDEFQNFSGSMFDKLLSEDAKFGCAMLLSTQNLKRLNQIKEGLLEIVLSNCENLCTFNVSATDAKVLEDEFQQKVTQKHIISQPRLHCYTRLAIPGYPLQFASVHIIHPGSWKRDASHPIKIVKVRQRNRARFLPVAVVDQQHEEHLKHFLNVHEFAESIQRETRARESARQQQAKAADLSSHVNAQRNATHSSQPSDRNASAKRTSQQKTASTPVSESGTPAPQGLRTTSSAFTTAPPSDRESMQPEEEKENASASRSSQEAPHDVEEKTAGKEGKPKGRRNHNNRGSRRVDRLQTMGTPSPDVSHENPGDEEQNAEGSKLPLPPPSTGREGFEGRERERRERG